MHSGLIVHCVMLRAYVCIQAASATLTVNTAVILTAGTAVVNLVAVAVVIIVATTAAIAGEQW